MIGILSGLILLFLSIYVTYQGSIMDNTWLKVLGTILFLGSGIYIALTRLKMNIKKMNTYKQALINLSNDPKNETLKEQAYNLGIDYYKNKRDNKKILPLDMKIIERDITLAMERKK